MALTLLEQHTLVIDPEFIGRVESAATNYAAYIESLRGSTDPAHVALVAALGSWSRQAVSDSAVRADWTARLKWYGVRKAVTENVTLAQAQASGFDAVLGSEIETQIRHAHGVA